MPTPDTSHALDNIVVVLFENRSLDNVLGHLYGTEDGKTFDGVIGKNLSNPIPEWAEHGAERKVVPYTVATDMAVVGIVLAVWSLTGAMQTLMWALNSAYERQETRGFLKRRLTALVMVILMLFAFVLAFGLLVLGPQLSGWIGNAVGVAAVIDWLWWTAQWPVLIFGLLIAFATILYLGPNVDHPRWQFLSFGTAFAVAVWLLGSGAFAVFVSQFGSYNKAWGSLAAVIVM